MLETELIGAANSASKDLLIALHGLGDSMEGYRWIPSVLKLPALNVLLVNAPDPYFGGFSWYDFARDAGPGVERSYRLMAELLDSLAERGFPSERTILFGFSQGCLMTYETGLRYAARFAGLIGVSGYVHEPERLLKQLSPVAKEQRFFITHGTADPLIPLAQVRPQVEQLRRAGLQIDFHAVDKEHTVIESEIVQFRTFIKQQLGYH